MGRHTGDHYPDSQRQVRELLEFWLHDTSTRRRYGVEFQPGPPGRVHIFRTSTWQRAAVAIIWTVRWQVVAARAMRTARVMADSIVGIGSFGSPQQKREVGVRPGGSSGFGVAAEAGSLRVDLNEALR